MLQRFCAVKVTGEDAMIQALYQRILAARNYWKPGLTDAILVLLIVVSFMIFILSFYLRVSHATALLMYLFIIFFLIHKRKILIAIIVSVIGCIIVDFFLVQPFFSLNVGHLEEGLDLALFLLFVLVFSYMYSRSQKQADKAIQHEHTISASYEEKLYKQTEETSRREHELRIFSDTVREVHKEKDLKRGLSYIAQAIDNAFSTYGIQGCIFLLPNLERASLQSMLVTQSSRPLSHEEETSTLWVIQHGQSVELRTTPNVVRTTGSYIRWRVANSLIGGPVTYSSSYIAPLLSRSKVIGGIRLLVEDTTHPRFLSIKKSLEMHISGSSNPQPDSFLEFLNHAVSLIEQALIERALRRQEEEQQELWSRIEEFYTSIISLVSHDLKTPLTLIKGAASSLLDQGDAWNDEAERQTVLTEIVSEVNWLELIINRMFELSRIEQGALKLDKDLYPIETIVLDTLERRHIQALLQDRHIEKSGLEDLPPVEVDPILIEQVLGNLLENAARYTPVGSSIEINGRADKGHVVLSIIDCGPGIPSTEKERIFEKFHRISRKMEKGEETASLPAPFVPSVQGTGLGLAVCRGFVEAHNGRIWVENLDSGGAKFQFTLPLRQKRDST
jgi:two-component system, OmpR family, sensor histidine kinase KdpD